MKKYKTTTEVREKATARRKARASVYNPTLQFVEFEDPWKIRPEGRPSPVTRLRNILSENPGRWAYVGTISGHKEQVDNTIGRYQRSLGESYYFERMHTSAGYRIYASFHPES